MPPGRSSCLLLMLRAPLPGRVKTRLAASVGPEAALALYRACVEDMLEAITARMTANGPDLAVFVEPPEHIALVRDWLGIPPLEDVPPWHFAPPSRTAGALTRMQEDALSQAVDAHSSAAAIPGRETQSDRPNPSGPLPRSFLLPQPPGDLGARLDGAFRWAFATGYRSAAALGSDLPGLGPLLAPLAQALADLAPALIGPSPDGGYWTIGFSAPDYLPEVFQDMPWSTPALFARTMVLLAPLSPRLLPELLDLDTLEDLRALAAQASAHPHPAHPAHPAHTAHTAHTARRTLAEARSRRLL